MPNTRQAEKRMRRDAKRRIRNRYHLSKMKTYIRKFRRMVEASQLEEAKQFLPQVVSIIYHTASKGVIHKKEASRRASRVSTILNKALQKVQG
ncbi:30S ribosomal protein S20 [Hydrogenobacter sp. T-2]|uniref:30S ribosomal protein S20 n=1 Tax=Pampinifervens diazotrophicum TaxID=1632018 RepID=UPI002B25BD8F|nr:30S ribosomal protein S20 [Hydrogenobacter sp. T-2]WPM32452.1 30S ribosomal protein S20 [Hydrogenobacter sp. T-2]